MGVVKFPVEIASEWREIKTIIQEAGGSLSPSFWSEARRPIVSNASVVALMAEMEAGRATAGFRKLPLFKADN